MERGSLIERRLDNAVFREIKKIDKASVVGAGIGIDYSLLDDIVATEGTGESPAIAWVKAMNNFACAGGVAAGVRLTMLLPENTKESFVKACMAEFQEFAEEAGIQIAGGHTQVSDIFSQPFFSVHILGKVLQYRADKRNIKDGSSIVMCGYAGMLGTDILIKNNAKMIAERFGNNFSKGYVFGTAECNITKAAEALHEYIENDTGNRSGKVLYMHDISCGGVYAALWQLGRFGGCGFTVNNDKIAIKQETIEICEALDKNPYLIDGTGGFLLVCDNPEEILKSMTEQGIVANLIGRINKTGERCVAFGDGEMRTLSASLGDEIY